MIKRLNTTNRKNRMKGNLSHYAITLSNKGNKLELIFKYIIRNNILMSAYNAKAKNLDLANLVQQSKKK